MTWREWWCLTMPWHRTSVVKNYGSSVRTKCDTCGAEWGLHHGARAALPWRHVADIYDDLDRLAAEYKP